MNAQFFLEAMNEIDDKYIEEARCYRMKKRFPIKRTIAAAACVALMVGTIPLVKYFAGAPSIGGTTQMPIIQLGASGEFTVLEVDDGDKNVYLNANHKTEFDNISTYDFIVDTSKIDKVKKVEFCGKEWYGFYSDTRTSKYYNDNTDRYVNKEAGVRFEINSTTGKCTSFFLSTKNSSGNDAVLSRNECYEKAIDFLMEYLNLTDAKQYKLTSEKYRGGNLGYQFMLCLMVGELQTSERVTIGVRENGEIFSYVYHSPESMKNIDASAINWTMFSEAIDTKMETIYGDFPWYDYEIEYIEIVRLSDGSYMFDCKVVSETQKVENGGIYEEKCRFIIKTN